MGTVAVLILFTSAQKNTVGGPIEIIGKMGFFSFKGGIKVEEKFLSDTTLHWKYTGPDGVSTESDEHITYRKIGNGLFFVNWIEKTGLTVSQVLDVKKGTAIAFTTLFDEKSDRGQRSSRFLEGSLVVK